MNRLTLLVFIFITSTLLSCNRGVIDRSHPDESIYKLSGTFVDFWYKSHWNQSDWEKHFQEMKEVEMNLVIIQFTSYEDYTWFDSDNSFTNKKYSNALSNLLQAAVNESIEVYIGLYFDEQYWRNQTNSEWLSLHADRCIEIAIEINDKYGDCPAFKGWYIPHEPEPYAYNSPDLMNLFKNTFINKISDKLHSLNGKPVSIAAFFNSDLTSTTQLSNFMKGLGDFNLQIIMLQDGVGVNHVSLDRLYDYYKAAADGLFSGNFNGEFWTDLETFTMDNALENNIERIIKQLEIELSISEVSKAVSFQYFTDFSPMGPNGETAMKLRSDYLNYINKNN